MTTGAHSTETGNGADSDPNKYQDQFTIRSENAEFNEKKNSTFASLSMLEKKHEAFERVTRKNRPDDFMKSDPVEDRLLGEGKSGQDFRARFERRNRGGAGGPNGRRRNAAPYVPMYRKEPRKWTMYDLSDVKADQMSERSTRNAALSFLDDLKKRKTENADGEGEESCSKVMFKKPKAMDDAQGSTSSVCRSDRGKVVMPEYHFGRKKDKVKKSTSGAGAAAAAAAATASSAIRLSHLDDAEDEVSE